MNVDIKGQCDSGLMLLSGWTYKELTGSSIFKTCIAHCFLHLAVSLISIHAYILTCNHDTLSVLIYIKVIHRLLIKWCEQAL